MAPLSDAVVSTRWFMSRIEMFTSVFCRWDSSYVSVRDAVGDRIMYGNRSFFAECGSICLLIMLVFLSCSEVVFP